jgi:VanZ family protein
MPSRSTTTFSWIRLLPMLGWMMFIFWASHQTETEINDRSWVYQTFQFIGSYFPADKLVHGVVYGILGSLGALAMIYRPWLNWVICVIYGMSDEFHQSFIPGRSVEAMDVLADAVGAGVMIFLIFSMTRTICSQKGHQ